MAQNDKNMNAAIRQTSAGGAAIVAAFGKPESSLLQRLLGLYEEERQVYGRVLDLSRQQGKIVRRGGQLGEVQRVVQKKRGCMEVIAGLELQEKANKQEWKRCRPEYSLAARLRLQQSLGTVTGLIEEILICEEQNELYLIQQAGTI